MLNHFMAMNHIEDEEVDFEKLINAPLPKVPRDVSFTGKSSILQVGLHLTRFSTLACSRRSPAVNTPKSYNR